MEKSCRELEGAMAKKILGHAGLDRHSRCNRGRWLGICEGVVGAAQSLGGEPYESFSGALTVRSIQLTVIDTMDPMENAG